MVTCGKLNLKFAMKLTKGGIRYPLVIGAQRRIQGRHQLASGHPLSLLKNKNRMVKNKFYFDSNILFI
jgi:hypothetical protein